MKKIGMIVAVEIKAVLERYGVPQGESVYPGYKVLCYEAKDYAIYVLSCGAGEIAAAAGTQFLISEFKVDMIVNFGVVGGLTEEMEKSGICVVESVVHYDFDTSEADSAEVGRYLAYPDIYIPATPKLVEKAQEFQPLLKKVICASGDKFIGAAEKKRELHRIFGADICEMEAAGIVLTSNRNKVPCLLIKAVADSIRGGADEFRQEIENSAEIAMKITDRIIKELL